MKGIPLEQIYQYYLMHPLCNFRQMSYSQFQFYYTKYINERS
jgi:hypothetical protein